MNQQQSKNKKMSGGVKTAALDFKEAIDFTAFTAHSHGLPLNVIGSEPWHCIGSSKYLKPHPGQVLAWIVGSSECLRKGFKVVMPILRDDGEIVPMAVTVTNDVMNHFNHWAASWRELLKEQQRILESDNKEVTDDEGRTS